MKKILMFIDYYSNGGIEKVIENITNNSKKEYYFIVLSFVNTKNSKESLLRNPERNFFKRNILGIKELKKYLKKTNPKYDIIHIHCYNAFGLIYAKIFSKFTKRIIIHAHNSGVDNDSLKIKTIINYLIKRIINPKKYELVACSREASLFCFNKIGTIIPNGVSYKQFKFSSDKRIMYRQKYNLNKTIIAQIGRLEAQKNHTFMLDVFKTLTTKNDNYQLVIIGTGTLKKQLQAKVAALKITNKVIFIDYIDNLSEVMNAFDIVVFPSLYEGFGLVAIESQINNRYTIISTKISSDIIISNNTAYLELIKDKWVEVIKNYSKKKLSLKRTYELTTFINKIESLYDK